MMLQRLFASAESGYLKVAIDAGIGNATLHGMVNGRTFPRWRTLKAVLIALGIRQERQLAAWQAAHGRARDDKPPACGPATKLGWLLAEVSDPFMLEVHRPIRVDEHGGPALPLLPPYLLRKHDQELAQVVARAAGGESVMAVLVGGSSTGKTRACWEALAPLRALPGWRLWHPFDPTRPEAALAGLAQVGPRTVVWLNETQLYLETSGDVGERVAAALHTLLTDPARRPALVLGTIWPREWNTLTTRANLDRHSQARTLLTNLAAPDIAVPEAFTDKELSALRDVFGTDPRLARARAEAVNGHITQYLAGVPELLKSYQHAPPTAKAIIDAAMDARRLGFGPAIPLALLEEVAQSYLSDLELEAAGDNWLKEALDYTAKPCKGVPGPLTRIRPRATSESATVPYPGPLYRLAEYLYQYGRRIRSDLLPPAAFWTALSRYAAPPDLMLLANAALDRGLDCHAAQLVKRAATITTPLDTHCAYRLVKELQRWGATDQAAVLAKRAAAHGSLDHPHDVVELITILRELGATDRVTALIARNPASHVRLDDPRSVARLVRILQGSGATGQALTLAKRAATHVLHLGWPGHVGLILRVLRDLGATDQFTALAKNAAAHACLDDPTSVSGLLRSLQELGAPDQALALAKRAATRVGLGSPIHVVMLLEELLDMGATDQATALVQHAATNIPLSDAYAVATLLEALRRLSATDQALALAKRAATPTVLDHQYGVPALLETMREVGATDQVNALAHYARLDNPNGVAALLEALQKAGATDHVTALIARNPAAHAHLGDVYGVAALLRAMREVGATDQVTALAQRAATNAPLDHLHGVAALLKELRKLGTTEHASVLAQRAATHAPLDDPRGTAVLLKELRKLGTTEHASVLAQRAATHAPLDDPRGTAVLLRELRESSDTNQAFTLARRAATDICLEDSTRVEELLGALRELGMTDQISILIDRLPAAGHFFLFLKQQGTSTTRFRFGRNPDGSPAGQWSWNELE
ncbi:hypothetical protein ACTMTI_20810 [Nonomuraea sp. H19]|uniref:hypothetical protein n=1 Tax=Nonomuraea sp. H19 TaxID=3452206 RepID=UPI003F8A166A